MAIQTTLPGDDRDNTLNNRGRLVKDEVLIDAAGGNDTVDNEGNLSSIMGGDGDDSINNKGNYVSIRGGKGDDTIQNSGNNVNYFYDLGDGNDTIYGFNPSDKVLVFGSRLYPSSWTLKSSEDGKDNLVIGKGRTKTGTFTGTMTYKDLNGGALHLAGIPGLEGSRKEIFNHINGSTITGGFGDDTVNNYADNILFCHNNGDGDDIIHGFNATSTLKIGDGTASYSAQKSDDDIIVNVYYYKPTSDNARADYKITLTGAASLSTVNIIGDNLDTTPADSSVDNFTEGNDTCNNTVDSVALLALGGDDKITNSGASVTIDGMGGNDYVYNNDGTNVSINGGEGNDSIKNYDGTNVTIDGGAGDDSIFNDSTNVSISGGEGNDTIWVDKFYSWNAETQKYDIDNLLPPENVTVDGGAGDDSIDNNGGASVSIDGGEGDDTIESSGTFGTIDGSTGNDSIKSGGTNVSISGGEGNDTIWVDKFYSWNAETGKYDIDNLLPPENVTVDGGAGHDTIEINGYGDNNATIDGGDGNDRLFNGNTFIFEGEDVVSLGSSNVSMNGGTGDDSISNYGWDVTINAGEGSDTISLDSYAKNALIEYADGDGNDTVTGFDGDDTLKIGNGTTDTYSKATVDNDIIITVGDGSILLKGAASLEAVNISGEDESSAADNWTLADGVAKYKNLFTLSGINPNLTVDELDSVINVDGNKIILSADALGKSDVTLTTTGDYTLALGDDCPTVTATEKGWSLSGTTATYHDAGKTDGYKLTNTKTVTYTAATVGKALLTVNGVVEGVSEEDLNENLTVSGKVLTVTPDVVGENFSVGAGYKVVFDEGDYGGSKFTGTTGRDTIEVNGNGLQIDGGKGNDTITSNGDGGNIYLIASTVGADVVVGYGDDDTIKITDDSNVTASVKASDIIVKAGKATMTLKNAATGTHLNIVDADDETLIDQTFYADRTVADGEVKLLSTFNSTSFTATDENPNVDGSAVSRKFSLTGGDEDNTLIGGKGANFIDGGGGSNELTGGKGNDTFVAGGGNDTITDYGVGTDKISLAADVTGFEVDGSDVILNFDDDKSMTIANGAGKKVNFVRNGRTTPEIFMTGGKISSNSKSITLASGTGSFDAGTVTTLVTIDGGLTENVFITGNAQSNKIFGGSGDDTLNGGTKNATLTGGDGDDIFIYESGKDIIADYVSGEDKISLTAAPISESLNSKGDVVLKFSSANQLTIKGGDEILFVTDGDEVTKTYLNDRIVGDDGVTLQSNFKATEFTLEELPKVDATATSAKVTLNGNDSDNVLIGGKGANLIDGGAGDDILIGNGGADTFVYSSGDDTISDYESRDRVSLTSAIESFGLSGDDVIIGFGSNSLTISDAANASITFLEEVNGKVTTNVNIFAADGIFNGKRTAVTLNADTSSYTANSSMLTIDGGLAKDEIEIVGNAKNNHIHAGNFGSTLNGGGGKDSLWGGDGSDTFIYSSGGDNDVIYNFGNDDALQIEGKFTASVVGENVTFKVGSTANAITLKDFTATNFNVNGDTYRISGNNFVK